MKKVKVLYAPINGINVGGLSTIAFNLGINMDENKIKLDFFSTYKMKEDTYKKIVNKKSGEIYEFDINNKKNVIERKLQLIKEFYKVIKIGKYDIIHLHIDSSYSAILLAIITKFASNSKIVLHSHNTSITGCFKNILHVFFKPMLKILGDEFLACSTEAGDWMYSKSILKNKKVRIIENGIELEKFLYNEQIRNVYRNELGLEDSFVIGHVGRFVEQKNHDFLIDIFYEIYTRNKKSILVLVGTGKLQDSIIEKVERLGLKDNVLFLNNRDDVNNLLQAFDLFILPSLFEGLPISAIEAQVSGLNMVLSDNITKETQIVPLLEFVSLCKSPEFWANEVLKYNQNYDRKKYEKEILESDFNIKKSALKLQDLYLKLESEAL